MSASSSTGIPVPLLYHAFLGNAVIHPAMTERIDFFRGPYPVSYGRYAGSVAALDTTKPERKLRGEASLRLSDAGAFLEVPVFGGRGSALLAGRYSFSSLLVSQFLEGSLEYWDYQALTDYDLDRKNNVSLFVFGAFDFCEELCSDPQQVNRGLGTGKTGVEFHRVDARFDHEYTRGHVRLAVTGGYDRTRGGLGFNAAGSLGQVRVQHEHVFSRNVEYRAGADALLRSFVLQSVPFSGNLDEIRELFFGRTEKLFGGYLELSYAPDARITVVPGVRVDFFQSAGDKAVGVDPRVLASFRLTPIWRALAEVGLSHQLPNFVPNVPGVQVAGIENGLQTALHTTGGFSADLPEQLSLSFALFTNAYFNLTDPFGITQDFETDALAAREALTGISQGVEVLFRRPLTKRLGGILSYTLSRTTRQRHDFPSIETVAAYDRPHVLNAALTYEPFENWRFGVRTVLYSGIPGSRPTVDGPVFDQNRGPPFFRLDARAERSGHFGNWGSWALTAEVLNATLSREVIRRPCNQTGTICDNIEVGPLFLPNLGFELRY